MLTIDNYKKDADDEDQIILMAYYQDADEGKDCGNEIWPVLK